MVTRKITNYRRFTMPNDDYIENILNSPYRNDDGFNSAYDEDAAIDDYIDRCMNAKRNSEFYVLS